MKYNANTGSVSFPLYSPIHAQRSRSDLHLHDTLGNNLNIKNKKSMKHLKESS